MSACEYCGAPVAATVSNQAIVAIPSRHGPAMPYVPPEPEVHKIVTKGPNGYFEAVFTHEEWMDRSPEAMASKHALQRHIHRQAGHEWELRIGYDAKPTGIATKIKRRKAGVARKVEKHMIVEKRGKPTLVPAPWEDGK